MKKYLMFLFLSGTLALTAAEYKFRLPVQSTASVEEQNGNFLIECRFAPTRALSKATNRKIDFRHAQKIVHNALRAHVSPKAGTISFSGLQNVKPPTYDGNKSCSYYFSIPKNGVRVIAALPAKAQSQTKAPAKTAPQTASAKPAAKQPEKQQSAPKTPVVTNPGAPLITDNDLRNLGFAGYSIRLKEDLVASLEDFEEQLSALNGRDMETLNRLLALKQNLKQQVAELKRKISQDSLLVASDIETISNALDRKAGTLQESIRKYADSLLQELLAENKNELAKLKRDLESAVPEEKEDIKELIHEMEKSLSLLQKAQTKL